MGRGPDKMQLVWKKKIEIKRKTKLWQALLALLKDIHNFFILSYNNVQVSI